MFFLGICGASGSGKTTLALALQKVFEDGAIILPQDSYYRDHSDVPFEQRAGIDYDDPSAFDHELLYQDIRKLVNGGNITEKDYNYNYHIRSDTGKLIVPKGVLIFEGIHAFHDERLTAMMDLKVYMDTDPDTCLIRRIRRDTRERMRSLESVLSQYETTVKPAYDKYITGYKRFADVVVTQNSRMEIVTDMLANYIDKKK